MTIVAIATAAGCHPPHEDHYVAPEGSCELTADFEVPAAATPIDTFAYRLGTGMYAEIDLEIGDTAELVAHFEASGAAVDWNLHTHAADGEVILHEEGSGAVGTVDRADLEPDLYSLMYSGRGPVDATLCVGVYAAGDVELVP